MAYVALTVVWLSFFFIRVYIRTPDNVKLNPRIRYTQISCVSVWRFCSRKLTTVNAYKTVPTYRQNLLWKIIACLVKLACDLYRLTLKWSRSSVRPLVVRGGPYRPKRMTSSLRLITKKPFSYLFCWIFQLRSLTWIMVSCWNGLLGILVSELPVIGIRPTWRLEPVVSPLMGISLVINT